MRNKNSTLYEFNDYLVEAGKGCLWRDKELVALTPKAFETLLVLLKHRGEVVEKDVLLNEVWADTFVEEATLAQNISTLRRALGTTSDGKQFIETVPRRGYRFVADVKEIVGDEEVFVLERRVRTQITAEHETVADEITLRPNSTQRSVSIWQKIKSVRFLAAFVSCIILTGLFFAARHFYQPETFSASKFRQFTATKLTSDGNVYKVAVSPDGKYLAYVEKRGDLQSLFVRQIDESATVEILPPKKQRFIGLTFAPDGKQIYYATYEKENLSTPVLIGNLYRISMLGGIPQLIVSDIDSPVAVAPDRRRFAFIRHHNDESYLMIADLNDVKTSEKILSSRKIAERFSSEGLAWSPDGKTIVCGAFVADYADKQMDAIFVNAETGEQRFLTKENWSYVGQTSWLADSSAAVFPAFNRKNGGKTDDIWLVAYPSGEARQISNGISGAFGLGLTADSDTLVTVKSERLTTFETTSAPDFLTEKNISQNLSEYNPNAPGIIWTTGDLILYGSTLNGNQDIWAMKTDGSNKRQLTSDAGADFLPVATFDNRLVVFVSNRDGKRDLWTMKPDGSEQKRLTNEGSAFSPSISPDNQWIFYSVYDEQKMRPVLHKISVNGGKSSVVTTRLTHLPRLSPDGKLIACYSSQTSDEPQRFALLKLTILSATDGSLIKQFDTELNQENLLMLAWKDERHITYLTNEDGVSKIWEQSVESDAPQILLASPTGNIFRHAWSPDGRKIIYEKGSPINDIILIESSN